MARWIPFDADESEIVNLQVIREGIPSSMRPALLAWIQEEITTGGHGTSIPATWHFLQANLDLDFGWPATNQPHAFEVMNKLEREGDRTLLRVVDLLLATKSASNWGDPPAEVETLRYHLEAAGSSLEIVPAAPHDYRLRRRVLEGVEELAQAAIDASDNAGRHLANAWNAAFGITTNPSFAMTEAIRAVEVAAGATVIPKDKKPSLGKALAAMQAQGNWGLALSASDGYPNHFEVLVGMIETLAKAQPDRHGGESPSLLEAQGHVQLASTLTYWFSARVVRPRE